MSKNQWLETSRKIYAAFLNIYPKEHRSEYGEAMRQVFTDQCRSAYEQNGTPGIAALWLRTLPDLGYTALLEHVTSPSATWGLMEPVPNAPLPWKGIFLILLPGLVYLVSQIAQLTGQPWYMTVYYRAAFFLIIPVLVVWAITRRFPLWGLIPLGLLYRLLQEIGYQLIVLHPSVFSSNPFLNLILNIAKQIQKDLWFLIIPMALAILILAWRYTRQQKPPRSFWIWTGLYLLIACVLITQEYISMAQYAREYQTFSSYEAMLSDWFNYSFKWSLYDITAFLLLIFLGTLFTRRHGFFAILIPVGYILPTVLIGTPWNLENTANPALTLTIATIAILAYRILLSLVAPIWMSRTRSMNGKKRIILISIALALGIHAVMQFYLVLFFADLGYHITSQWIISVALEELKLITAICLGIVMYQNAQPTSATPDRQISAAQELSTEKA